ncbi:hypothetical protein LWI29_032766 [Acer saccharum]|uniref:Uncharacterized protein n=1 Tax=Acer saccharum TaxID=4024 RepID=A0AA39W4U0_ACESA|nr:hypothetical protein LWI29_032766 [Acer saccharum]
MVRHPDEACGSSCPTGQKNLGMFCQFTSLLKSKELIDMLKEGAQSCDLSDYKKSILLLMELEMQINGIAEGGSHLFEFADE